MKSIKELTNDIVNELVDKDDGGLDIVKIVATKHIKDYISESNQDMNFTELYDDIFWRILYELQTHNELARIIASEQASFYVIHKDGNCVDVCAVLRTFDAACNTAFRVAEENMMELTPLNVDSFREIYRQCGKYVTVTADEANNNILIVSREQFQKYESSRVFTVTWKGVAR